MITDTSKLPEIDLKIGESTCLVFASEMERQAGVVAFLRAGLAHGQRALYLVSETHDATLLDYLHPRRAARPGQVRIQRVEDTVQSYAMDGRKFILWLKDQVSQAHADGFTGLTLAVEMGWAAGKFPALPVLGFEMDLRSGLEGLPAQVLTLYDRRLFAADVLMHVMTVHPLILNGAEVYQNPFYIPAVKSEMNEPAGLALQNWLDHLQAHRNGSGPQPESGEQLRAIMASMPVVVFALDREGVFTLSEGKGLESLGLAPGEVVGRKAFDVFPDLTEVRTMLRRALMGDTFNIETQVGGSIWETRCSPLRNPQGEIVGMLGISADITERRQAEKALRASEERYRTLVENQGEGAAIFAADGQVLFINMAAGAILGTAVESIIGHNIREFLPPDQVPIMQQQMEMRRAGEATSYEIAIQRPDGARRQMLVTSTPRFDAEGQYLGAFTIFRDITDRKRREDRLLFQSSHDALTGLYNRFYFDQELAQIDRNRHYPVSLIVVDIDNMKETNDNSGHLAGDDLLRRVARLLRSTFRAEDVVARIGGDEFSVILPDSDQLALDRSIERLHQNLERANIQSSQPPLVISIGGASADVGQSLLKAFDLADQRMYRDKYARKRKN